MAVRFAVKSGNWSDSTVWDNGALPLSDDDVFANGFTVTVDQNITVRTLRNTATTVVVPNIATPVMLSNTTPSGIASASANNTQAFIVFDQNTSTAMNPGVNTPWFQYQFPSTRIIKRYRCAFNTGGGTTTGPASWRFQGSNDGVNFITLETVTGNAQTFYTSGVLPNTTAYLYYRLQWDSLITLGYTVQMAELEMTESTGTTGGVSGGVFVLNGGITATPTNGLITNGSSTLISHTTSATTPTILNSGISFQAFTGNIGIISKTGLGTLTINGVINGPNNNGGGSTPSAINITSGILNINGNVIGGFDGNGGSRNSHGIIIGGISTVNIVGGVTGGSNLYGSQTYGILGSSLGTVNITGNVIGGNQTTAGNGTGYAIGLSSSNLTVTINGNVIGSTKDPAINSSATSQITINGDCSGTTYPAITSSGAINIRLNGSAFASATQPAISLTSGSAQFTLNGSMFNNNGKMAIYAPIIWLDQTGTTQARFFTSGGADRTLYSDNTFPNQPPLSDVRYLTQFGPSSGLTGTLRMASPTDVRSGVATDNTVGTALFDTSQLLAELNASSDPIAQRLRIAATPEILGQLIAAYKR